MGEKEKYIKLLLDSTNYSQMRTCDWIWTLQENYSR